MSELWKSVAPIGHHSNWIPLKRWQFRHKATGEIREVDYWWMGRDGLPSMFRMLPVGKVIVVDKPVATPYDDYKDWRIDEIIEDCYTAFLPNNVCGQCNGYHNDPDDYLCVRCRNVT